MYYAKRFTVTFDLEYEIYVTTARFQIRSEADPGPNGPDGKATQRSQCAACDAMSPFRCRYITLRNPPGEHLSLSSPAATPTM